MGMFGRVAFVQEIESKI